jgi:hypothetical protein
MLESLDNDLKEAILLYGDPRQATYDGDRLRNYVFLLIVVGSVHSTTLARFPCYSLCSCSENQQK